MLTLVGRFLLLLLLCLGGLGLPLLLGVQNAFSGVSLPYVFPLSE